VLIPTDSSLLLPLCTNLAKLPLIGPQSFLHKGLAIARGLLRCSHYDCSTSATTTISRWNATTASSGCIPGQARRQSVRRTSRFGASTPCVRFRDADWLWVQLSRKNHPDKHTEGDRAAQTKIFQKVLARPGDVAVGANGRNPRSCPPTKR
jgi:hypothetical protein